MDGSRGSVASAVVGNPGSQSGTVVPSIYATNVAYYCNDCMVESG